MVEAKGAAIIKDVYFLRTKIWPLTTVCVAESIVWCGIMISRELFAKAWKGEGVIMLLGGFAISKSDPEFKRDR